MAQQDQSLDIKTALEEIANFDGKTPDVFTWIKQIENAAGSLQEDTKSRLLKLLRHKVRDNTSDTI